MEYFYLETPITDVYGHECNCLIPDLDNPSYTDDPGTVRLQGSLRLYISVGYFAAGYRATDNFRFDYTIEDSEVDSMPAATSMGRVMQAVLRKCKEPVLDEGGNETNLLHGLVKDVAIQDALIREG